MQLLIVIPIVNLKLEQQEELILDNFKIINCETNNEGMVFSANFVQQFGFTNMTTIFSNHLLIFKGNPNDEPIFNDCKSLHEIGNMALNFASSLFNALWFIKDNSVYVKECFVEQYEGMEGTSSFKSLKCNKHFLGRYNSNHSGDFGPTRVNEAEIKHLTVIDKTIKINMKIDPAVIGMIPNFSERSTREMTDTLNFIPYTLNRYMRALMMLAKVQSEARVILKIAFQMSLYEALFTIGRDALTEQVTEKPALFIGGKDKVVNDNITFFHKAYDIRSKFFHGDRIANDPSVLVEMNKRLDQCTRIIFNKVLADLTIFTLSNSKTDKKRFRQFWQDLAHSHSRQPSWDLKTNGSA